MPEAGTSESAEGRLWVEPAKELFVAVQLVGAHNELSGLAVGEAFGSTTTEAAARLSVWEWTFRDVRQVRRGRVMRWWAVRRALVGWVRRGL